MRPDPDTKATAGVAARGGGLGPGGSGAPGPSVEERNPGGWGRLAPATPQHLHPGAEGAAPALRPWRGLGRCALGLCSVASLFWPQLEIPWAHPPTPQGSARASTPNLRCPFHCSAITAPIRAPLPRVTWPRWGRGRRLLGPHGCTCRASARAELSGAGALRSLPAAAKGAGAAVVRPPESRRPLPGWSSGRVSAALMAVHGSKRAPPCREDSTDVRPEKPGKSFYPQS